MNCSKCFYAGLLVVGLLFWTGCKKESLDSYLVSIEIEAPATAKIGEPFEVTVNYARDNDIIHNVLIEILNEHGHQSMKLEERHVHESNTYSFTQADIVLDKAGTYTLRAFSSDMHDGETHSGEHGGEHMEEMDGHDSDATSDDKHNTVEHTIVIQ